MSDIVPEDEAGKKQLEDDDLEDVAGGVPYETQNEQGRDGSMMQDFKSGS